MGNSGARSSQHLLAALSKVLQLGVGAFTGSVDAPFFICVQMASEFGVCPNVIAA